MKARWWLRFLWALGVVLVAVSCVDERCPSLRFERAPKGSSSAAMPMALRAAYVAAVQNRASPGYGFEPTAAGFHAESAAQGLRAELRAEGVEVASSAGGWAFHPAPARWGCDDELMAVEPARPGAEGNRATYQHEGFDEWYVNGPLGMEQGFTLPAPPACRRVDRNGVVIELQGGLDATLSSEGKVAVLRESSGREVLRYTDLHVTDAAGKELSAKLVATAASLSIRFEDREALYPVTVDPLIWVQEAQLVPGDGVVGDHLGASVAVSTDTAVVGAAARASYKGAVYVFVRSGSSWSQQAELTASDGSPLDYFGQSVALSGDTVVVGAPGKAMWTGAAYVFLRSGASWSEQQKLTESTPGGNHYFAYSVAVSGDTALVAAHGKASYRGSAYVFVRSGASWSPQTELTANDGVANDYFGQSVALSGDTAAVAAYGKASQQGAAYVFFRTGSLWSQHAKLTASDGVASDQFGLSVALNADTAIVGACGRAAGQGAAYVFVRSGTSWPLQQELTASDGVAGDAFGCSVAVSGDIAVVGAEGRASVTGAAYVFARAGSAWTQQQELTANNGALHDSFGNSAAMIGNTAILGASDQAGHQGTAYVFVLPGVACSLAADCANGFCVDGVCCSVAACTAADQCHDAGTCQPGTGVCSSPAKPNGAMCSIGTCQAGACAPSADAGADGGSGTTTASSSSSTSSSSTGGAGGSGGMGGTASSTSGSGSGSTGGAAGTGGTTSSTTGSGITSASGVGGSGGKPPEPTVDLSCRSGGAPTPETSGSTAWLGAIILLALHRRRRR